METVTMRCGWKCDKCGRHENYEAPVDAALWNSGAGQPIAQASASIRAHRDRDAEAHALTCGGRAAIHIEGLHAKDEELAPPRRLDKPLQAFPSSAFRGDVPDVLRMSKVRARLKKLGVAGEEPLRVLDNLYPRVGNRCPRHGELKDPIVLIVNDEVGFGCPWCSGDLILERWKAEGSGES